MKFYRLDENTLKCLIFSSDLEEYGISLDDMMEHNKAAMDFLREVLDMAAYATGFENRENLTSMRIGIINNDTIVVLASNDYKADLIRFIKELERQVLDNIIDAITKNGDNDKILNEVEKMLPFSGHDAEDEEHSFFDMMHFSEKEDDPAISGQGKQEKNKNSDKNNAADEISPEDTIAKLQSSEANRFGDYVFCFSSITALVDSLQGFKEPASWGSSLYKNDSTGEYNLVIFVPDYQTREFAVLFRRFREYGNDFSKNPAYISHIKEMNRCIISDRAIERFSI